jgi:hypothetical protein
MFSIYKYTPFSAAYSIHDRFAGGSRPYVDPASLFERLHEVFDLAGIISLQNQYKGMLVIQNRVTQDLKAELLGIRPFDMVQKH